MLIAWLGGPGRERAVKRSRLVRSVPKVNTSSCVADLNRLKKQIARQRKRECVRVIKHFLMKASLRRALVADCNGWEPG
jgi:hypothetical protein